MIDRSIQPDINTIQQVNLPPTITSYTANGIKFMSLKTGTQSVLRLSLVFEAGTRFQHMPFVSSTTLNMMSEGTKNLTSEEISRQLDFYGLYYDTSIDRDYTILTISCLNKFLPEALNLLEQILIYPVFNENELSIYASKRKQNIKIERTRPSYIAREEFAKALFGAEHPYGKSSDEELYDDITPEDLRAHHNKYYVAGNCFAVTSGLIENKQTELIKAFLEKIPSGDTIDDKIPKQAQSTQRVEIKREDSVQSNILIGKVLFPKTHPVYNAMQIVSMVLGGYFSSRLVNNLREEKGYTYGIYSTMVNFKHSGYFALTTDVGSEFRDDAIREILKEIEILRTELIPESELQMVKNVITGEMMRLIDGPFGVSDITIESEQCGLTNDMVNDFLLEVKNITIDKIRDIARKYLDIDSLSIVTVG